jgi:hypothetical protein
VYWHVDGWSLNGRKWSVDKCSEVGWSVVKCSEGLRNRVSIIIRRYEGHMQYCCFFHILLVLLCFVVYMVICFVCFYLILYIMCFCYVYVLLLLCMFRSKYCVSLGCSVYCLRVNVYCTTATGCQTQLKLTNISVFQHSLGRTKFEVQ